MSWHLHPGVRTGARLSLGERAADRLRDGMGTWSFLAGCLAFIVAWIVATDRGWLNIDNSQLTILNLALSTFAALQGGIILLAAKRSDRVASEVALHTLSEVRALRAELAELRAQR